MEQVSKMIHTDPLTGIANRRGFFKTYTKVFGDDSSSRTIVDDFDDRYRSF